MTAINKITTLAARQLQDETGITWDNEDVLIPYINLGIKELIGIRPEVNPVGTVLTLSAGVEQSIGTSSAIVCVLDFVCNMGTTGTTVGGSVTTIDKKIVDSAYPGWMTLTADDEVVMVVMDDRDPKKFYTIPPQPSTGQGSLKVIRSEIPAEATSTTETFALDDFYVPAMVDYTVSRALKEETTVPNALAKADSYYQSFLTSIGYTKNAGNEVNAKGK
jgi:hypothetical protein